MNKEKNLPSIIFFGTPELIPLYRFWNEEKQKHYYTTNQKEYENLINNPNYEKWKFERIEGYIPDIIVNNEGDISYG